MASNSLARRVFKRVLAPLMGDRGYRYVQAAAKSWDIRRGAFTEPEVALVALAVRPGDTVLDIGANLGMYCYHLSKAVGPSGRVVAFEPVPFTYQTLRIVTRLLGLRNVEVTPKGCSDHTDTVTFRVPLQSSGALMTGQAHLGSRVDERGGSEDHKTWEATKEITCEVVALDDFLPPLDDLPFLKIDIEGAELLAFRGAEKTIDRHRPTVLLEIYPWCLEGFGLSLNDLTGFFHAKGYGLYSYDPRARQLESVSSVEAIRQGNYVFLHPSRRDRLASILDRQSAVTS